MRMRLMCKSKWQNMAYLNSTSLRADNTLDLHILYYRCGNKLSSTGNHQSSLIDKIK